MPNVSSLLHHFTTYIVVKHDTHFKHTRFGLDKPYPFKQHIDFLLSYDNNVKTNVGWAEGFCRTHHDNCYDKIDVKSGELVLCQDFAENRQRIMDGKKVYFSSTLPADVFHTDKYLPPNVEISIVLRRFNPCFGVIQNNPHKVFRIRLKELKLRMRKVLPCERVRNRLNAELLRGRPFFCPIKTHR